MDDYEKQANDFLKDTNTTMVVGKSRYDKHFSSDTVARDIYQITLIRGNREYTFDFGQSLNSSRQYTPLTNYAKKLVEGKELIGDDFYKVLQKLGINPYTLNKSDFKRNENYAVPTSYDILACLTKYDPETFEAFCDDYGYDHDSISALKVYEEVAKEYKNVAYLWNETEIEALQELQ